MTTPTTKEMYLAEMREQGYSADDIGDFHITMIPYVLEKFGVPKNAKMVEVGIAQGHCSIAAHRAGQKDWDEKATAQLIKAGEGSPEFHLFMGKAHLNLEQYDLALADFQAAENANPKLTFVHFNLGLAYLKKQDYEHARDEFLKDAAVEPDLAFNYDELGDVYTLMQQYQDAEKSYREALRRDPRLLNSYVGLAKVYQRMQNYQKALSAIDSAGKLDPLRTDIHYLRGQILLRMGRKQEAKKELETSVRIDNDRRAQRQKQVESGTVPSPELLEDDQ